MDGDFLKLVNKTYKLLDFFPDGDPLKNKAKEKTLAVLENLTIVSNAEGWTSLKKEGAKVQLLDDIEILENYLKLGKCHGWIDGVNFLILVNEYNNIKGSLESARGAVRRNLEIVPEPPKIEKIGRSDLPSFTERQRIILRILSEREKVQVADIIKEIPNITKRTIRRDLDDLLKNGEILRIGQFNQVFYQKVDRTYI